MKQESYKVSSYLKICIARITVWMERGIWSKQTTPVFLYKCKINNYWTYDTQSDSNFHTSFQV